MTYEQWLQQPIYIAESCPRCHRSKTHLYPLCGCPVINPESPHWYVQHIFKWHHTCPSPVRFYDAVNDPDVLEYFNIT